MSRHTDESWFLYFYEKIGTARIQTTDGITLAEIAPIPPIRQPEPGTRVATIQAQFKENVRVMAAAQRMLSALKTMATYPLRSEPDPLGITPNGARTILDDFITLARDSLKHAEPPLFNVYEQHFKTGYKHHRFTGTNDECFNYILQHQGQSVDYALKHGGWKIESV